MEQTLEQHVCPFSVKLPERSPCKSRRHLIVRCGNDVFDVDLEGLEDFDVDSAGNPASFIFANQKVRFIKLKFSAVKPPFSTSVTGISKCCNGLFLVVGEPLVIWNPFKGGFKSLPGCEDDGIGVPTGGFSNTAYGFAYDTKKDDYKVVKVVNRWDNTGGFWIPSQGHIYSLKSNTWSRTAENFTYPVKQWCGDISGVLHTFQYTSPKGTDKTTIKAFNVESEEHYEVALPLGTLTGTDVGMALHKIDGWLSLICASNSETEIWVMLDYEKKCWWKLCEVCLPATQALLDMGIMKPITSTKNGSKVMYHSGVINLFSWHDLEKSYFDSITIKDLPQCLDFVEAYVESLVLLDGEKQGHDDQDKKQAKKDQDKKQAKKNIRKESDDSFSWMRGKLKP